MDLGILRNTIRTIDKHYHPHSIPKKNGGSRIIHIPTTHLKTIQKRINRQIFDNVIYPSYLFGGVREKDYVRNTSEHGGCNALVALDVKDFYPSITVAAVKKIFQYFCKFPAEVAETLAGLCCLNGRVPQGACTSSHLANLVLHDEEYHLAQYCKNKGWTYTRLLDDISVSSKAEFDVKEIDAIIRKVKYMLGKSALKLNNRKTRVLTKANPVNLMEVTGLWLNRGVPRAHRADRNTIRGEVHQCEVAARDSRTEKQYHELHNRVSGRVAKLSYLKHANSREYRERLRSVLPLYDEHQATNLLKQARYMAKTKTNIRKTPAYCKKYFILQHRLNILMRTDRGAAGKIRAILTTCRPAIASASAYIE
ncbi:reverse transcriptase family protein [Bordetella sp. H567]|uniref:reverse transcriptase family protein n=1 Tax=Bordetella sp. H567 TaxID=1697043 RepID=UPI0009789CE6|nr:reverse transcriptase family protein [Bordetella sp. H567]